MYYRGRKEDRYCFRSQINSNTIIKTYLESHVLEINVRTHNSNVNPFFFLTLNTTISEHNAEIENNYRRSRTESIKSFL